ncbi:2,3-diaminopropionate biosynthesis protein SbnB [Streptomyces solincola]|uniref:2,3-diaminopropionate biosynthesis protein SbnB n=1 Tax=Streptomyces solincola TaxID=2100817 RepID=A0A2S9PQF8_9ACTN|nr:2,3-diaminopropionate biosynthesis protein SbnB [Streptomyces solincola]PRH76632.1 2,3-diaminopropionate biosynthesis protein SbnB [Streptomyces solincola]
MRILGRDDVHTALDGLEPAVLDAVRTAYVLHGHGSSQVPFSSFLRPSRPAGSRVIALPARLDGPRPVLGLKWISSFPANVEQGLQRASSLQILNDLDTGYPMALLEGGRISAVRTAASAALAAAALHRGRPVRTAGLIGCGTINEQVVRYLTRTLPELDSVVLYDAAPGRAEVFAAGLRARYPHLAFRTGGPADALSAETVSIATTDSTYWLDLEHYPDRPEGQVILHLSLRDLASASLLGTANVVDDTEHVLREQTSLHRLEQQVGHRRFVHAEIAGILDGAEPPGGATVVFSPFGLGVLDLAVAQVVLDAATAAGLGADVGGFDPGRHPVTSTPGRPA